MHPKFVQTFRYVLLTFSFIIFLVPSTVAAETPVSGSISVDTTWTLANSPYIVGVIIVEEFTTLTIEPGVVIKFTQDGRMYVKGTLKAHGTESEKIYFTSLKDDIGGDTNGDSNTTTPFSADWSSLVSYPSGFITLNHTIVRYAGASPYCYITWRCKGSVMGVNGGSVAINNSELFNNGQYSVYLDIGTITVNNSELYGSYTGAFVSRGTLTVENSLIHDNELWGLASSGYFISPPELNFHNNTFSNNGTYDDDRSDVNLSPFTHFTNSGNTTTGGGISLLGEIEHNTVLKKDGLPYILSVEVAEGNTLTIEPGVIVKILGSIYVRGELQAIGTVDERIYFTSVKDDSVGGDSNKDGNTTTPSPNDWTSIFTEGNGIINLTHSVVRYGGDTGSYCRGYVRCYGMIQLGGGDSAINFSNISHTNSYSIYQRSGIVTINNSKLHDSRVGARVLNGMLTIENSLIYDNVEDGLMIAGRSLASPQLNFHNNTFSNNGTYDDYRFDVSMLGYAVFTNSGNTTTGGGIRLLGEIEHDTVLKKDGLPYILSVEVAEGNTLTIEPGVIVKFPQDGRIEVDGTLQAIGTVDERIYFTSVKDDSVGGDSNKDGNTTTPSPNDWISLKTSFSGEINLAYAVIQYGGSSCRGYIRCNGMIELKGGNVEVNSSDILYTTTYGIYQNYGTLSITNSKIMSNNIGVFIKGGDAIFHHNIVTDNTYYGLSVHSTRLTPLIATNNWWGDVTGPMHVTENPAGLGDTVIGNITFDPWLLEDPDSDVMPECCSNVAFLPGYQGSRLYKNGSRLWEPELSHVGSFIDRLFLNEDGTSEYPDILTKDIIDEVEFINIYKTFIQFMNEDMVTAGVINEWEALPYDWRLSLDQVLESGKKIGDSISYTQATSSPFIIQEIRRLAETAQNKKVTIVAHSNGGLLAKALLQKLEDDGDPLLKKIDKLILVASPQIGTPLAVEGLLHGLEIDIPFLMGAKNARMFGENMPTAYNLLPSEKYFKRVDEPVIVFNENLSSIPLLASRAGTNIDNFDDLYEFLGEDRIKPEPNDVYTPNKLNENLLTGATATHKTMDAWGATTTVEVIQIAGWGEDTIKGIEYLSYPGDPWSPPILFPKPIITSEGDGSVVYPSAHYLSTTTSTRYFVDLDEHNAFGLFQKNRDHKNIFEIDSLQLFTKSIIDETFDTNDLPEYIYGEQKKPYEKKPRLRLAVHSPVGIDIYDSVGRYTGFNEETGQTFEEIPNSYIWDIEGHKYLGLDGRDTYRIELRGEDVGTFTFEVNEVLNDVILDELAFVDIPTLPGMRAELVLEEGGIVAELLVDVDGDGSVDVTLTGDEEADAVGSIMILRQIIENTEMHNGLKSELNVKLNIGERHQEKGDTEKAVKEFDKIISVLEKEIRENEKHNTKGSYPKILTETAEKFIIILEKIKGLVL